MTDITRSRTITSDEFANNCLALIEEVHETGIEIVITKLGEPAARLTPPKERQPILGMYRDQIKIIGDIMSPAAPAEEWDVYSNPDRVIDPELGDRD